MKTHTCIKTAALLTLFVVGVYTAALAATIGRHEPAHKDPERMAVNVPALNRQEQGFLRFIRSSVGYPEFLQGKKETTTAEVNLCISDNGVVEKVIVSTEEPGLARYITTKLEGRTMHGYSWAWGHAYRFALSFRFV
ncbi:MAG: hypothetical protein ACK500_10270 [Flavobacteriales bacterium]